MIEKVICGFQTGADQAGARAAKSLSIPTGGWMPPEFMTEDGPRLQFRHDFNAREIERDTSMIYPAGGTDWGAAYKARTRLNVRDSDWTIYFGDASSRGGKATYRAFCEKIGESSSGAQAIYHHRGWLTVRDNEYVKPDKVAYVLRNADCHVLNIAGNRESSSPGIGAWVEAYLIEVFTILRNKA